MKELSSCCDLCCSMPCNLCCLCDKFKCFSCFSQLQKKEKKHIILQSLSEALFVGEMYKCLEQGLSIQTQSLFKHKKVFFELLNTLQPLQVLVVRSSNVSIQDILPKQTLMQL